jgi:hypothetical protein
MASPEADKKVVKTLLRCRIRRIREVLLIYQSWLADRRRLVLGGSLFLLPLERGLSRRRTFCLLK